MSDDDSKDPKDLFNSFSDEEIAELDQLADEIAKPVDGDTNDNNAEQGTNHQVSELNTTGSDDVDNALAKAKKLANNHNEIELQEELTITEKPEKTDEIIKSDRDDSNIPANEDTKDINELIDNGKEDTPPSWVSEGPPIDGYEIDAFSETDDSNVLNNASQNENKSANTSSEPDEQEVVSNDDQATFANGQENNEFEQQDDNSATLHTSESVVKEDPLIDHPTSNLEEQAITNNDNYHVIEGISLDEDDVEESEFMTDDTNTTLNTKIDTNEEDLTTEFVESVKEEMYSNVDSGVTHEYEIVLDEEEPEQAFHSDELDESNDLDHTSHDSDFSVEVENDGKVQERTMPASSVLHETQHPERQQPVLTQQPAQNQINNGQQPVYSNSKSLASFAFGSISSLFRRKNSSNDQSSRAGYSFSEHLKNAALRDVQKLKSMQSDQCKLLEEASLLTNPQNYDSSNKERVLSIFKEISKASTLIAAHSSRLSISTTGMDEASDKLLANNADYEQRTNKFINELNENSSKLEDKSIQDAAMKIALAFKELFDKIFSKENKSNPSMSV